MARSFVDIILDVEKNFIIPYYLDLEFIDDVSSFRCEKCETVMLQHSIAGCGHKFCQHCKSEIGDGVLGRKCPKCTKEIKKIAEVQELEFKKKVLALRTNCPNKRFGCNYQNQMRNVAEHFKSCLASQHEMSSNTENMTKTKNMNQEIKQLKSENKFLKEKIKDLEKKLKTATAKNERLSWQLSGTSTEKLDNTRDNN